MRNVDNRRTVVVSDFDGTITTKDTLLEFIKYACGIERFFIGFALHFHLLVMMKLNLYPNWKAKQKLFSWFFKGMKYDEFRSLGESFADKIECMRCESTIRKLKTFKECNSMIYVISASVDEWVRPFCARLGVDDVLCTKVEIDDCGFLTGKFITKNCYGQEKVNRFMEKEPDRANFYLVAFGDSLGDREIFNYADEVVLV